MFITFINIKNNNEFNDGSKMYETLKTLQNRIRVSTICVINTSKLAFDGIVFVKRGFYYIKNKQYSNYSFCIFQTSKEYHCNLNATYNIEIRFFLRCYNNLYNDVTITTKERTLFTLKKYTKNNLKYKKKRR